MYQVVGQRIREARRARRMSLQQLGGEELSRSFLSLVERGRSRISLRALGIVANRLDLPLRYFLEGTEPGEAIETGAATVAEWFVCVRQLSPDRLSIELRLQHRADGVSNGLPLSDSLLHVDIGEGSSP